jgi:rubrerythrin
MGTFFDVREVLEFAVFIEQNGFQFYSGAVKKLSDPKIINLFNYLAGEETKHEELFKKMAEGAGDFIPRETYTGEYQEYMKDLCKSHSLANREAIKGKVDGIKALDDAVDMALSFEKDSIVFFTEIKEITGFDRDGVVQKVINEELSHIRKILIEKKAIQTG